MEKYRPENLIIPTLFTQCKFEAFLHQQFISRKKVPEQKKKHRKALSNSLETEYNALEQYDRRDIPEISGIQDSIPHALHKK